MKLPIACTVLFALSGCATVMGDVRPFAPVPVAMPAPAISAQVAAAQVAAPTEIGRAHV